MAKSICIIDDNAENIQIAASFLKSEGYEIIFSDMPKKAIELIKEKKPSLILLDIMMPEINGFDIIKLLKNDEKTKGIPVIFLTAKIDMESLEKAFRLGGLDYITKPFCKEELVARVNTHIKLLSSYLEIKDKLLYKTIISKSAREGIVIHKKGKVIEANEAFLKMISSDINNAQDLNLLDYFESLSGYSFEKQIKGLRNFGIYKLNDKNQGSINVEARSEDIEIEQEKVSVLTIEDISEKEELKDAVGLTHKGQIPGTKRDEALLKAKEYSLTKRETQILEKMLEAYSNKEIASLFEISELTVKKHIGNIYTKADVKSRFALIAKLLM